MALYLQISLLVIGILESVIGIALNTVIVALSGKEVKNNRQTNPTYLLNLMMGLVNVLLLCVISIDAILYMACLPLLYEELLIFFLITVAWLIYLSFWLMSWLCIHYLAIVANFSHRLLLWLKRNFPSLLPYLLVVTVLGSFALSIISIWNNPHIGQSTNTTTEASLQYFNNLYRILSLFFGCWLPFLLSFISIGFTSSSILRHIWRIKHNGAGFTGPQLQAHINAIRTMILLFLLSVASYLVSMLGAAVTSGSTDIYLLNCLFFMSFPTLEATILILASSKLKKMFRMSCLTGVGNHYGISD